MSDVETGQMPAAETGQMSSVQTGQMSGDVRQDRRLPLKQDRDVCCAAADLELDRLLISNTDRSIPQMTPIPATKQNFLKCATL